MSDISPSVPIGRCEFRGGWGYIVLQWARDKKIVWKYVDLYIADTPPPPSPLELTLFRDPDGVRCGEVSL